MERAISMCAADETPLVEIFMTASTVRCLAVVDLGDRDRQTAVTKRILQAAESELEDLRGKPNVHPENPKHLNELVDIAKEHLRELGGDEKRDT